jgi:tetratricopeptide (TPR) repeat protein
MFSRGGFDAKAVAIYKQILRTEVDSLEARTHLGECFQRMGLTSDALREFQEAFKICQKKELKREAFELLRRVASLDPSNVANRLNLADLFARENMMDDARREYTSLLEEVRRQTGVDLVLRVAEHMRRAFPDSREALDALAWAKVQTGAHAEAVKLLKAALLKYPEDLALRESLVTALEGAGDENGARKVWREIAELYKMRGDVEKSREILQRHGAIASFGGTDETTTPSLLLTDPTAAAADTAPDGDDDDDIDLELDEPAAPKTAPRRPDIVEKVSSSIRAPGTPVVAKPPPRIEPPSAPEKPTSPAELVAEARVALEFGDPAEAERLAKLVLEADPDSRDARKILTEIAGEKAAEEEFDVEVEIDEPEPEEAPEGEALAIERNAHEAAEEPEPPKPVALRSKPELAALAPHEDFDSLPDIEIVLEDEEDKDGEFASVEPPAGLHDAPAAKRAAKAKPAVAAKAAPAKPAPAAADDDFDIEVEIDDGSEAGPDLDQAPAKQGKASAPELGPDGDESLEFSEPLASESKDVGSFAQSSARIEETLSEADFYVEQGLIDEAQRIYESVLVIVPSHPKAMLRLGELEAKRGGKGKAKRAPAAQPAQLSDPLGDTMVREPNGDEALSLPDMPEPAVPKPKKEAARPTPAAAKPVAPAKPAAKPAPAEPARPRPAPVVEEALPPLELEAESPEDLLAADEAEAQPEFHPSELTAEIEEEEAAEAAEAEPAHGEDDFDLAAHLDEDDDNSDHTIGTLVGVGSLGKGFSDVFSAFKKGIQQQVSEGDADTHYDLAIAYKEMGLNEDAVRELETVLRTGSRAIEALSLMATCKLSLGDAEAAAAHLEDALERAGDSDESSVSLRYDLAEALLSAGREAEALEAFQKVSAADPGFRDVAERIARFG